MHAHSLVAGMRIDTSARAVTRQRRRTLLAKLLVNNDLSLDLDEEEAGRGGEGAWEDGARDGQVARGVRREVEEHRVLVPLRAHPAPSGSECPQHSQTPPVKESAGRPNFHAVRPRLARRTPLAIKDDSCCVLHVPAARARPEPLRVGVAYVCVCVCVFVCVCVCMCVCVCVCVCGVCVQGHCWVHGAARQRASVPIPERLP